MSLANIAGNHGKMLRVTDSLGGCISLAETIVGTAEDFAGPQASMGFQVKAINAVGGGGGFNALTGLGDSGSAGAPSRFNITVTKNAPDLTFTANINTATDGSNEIATETIVLDTDPHSCALTYDEAGDFAFYVDGVEVASGAVPCDDMGEGAVVGTRFSVWGSSIPGAELFYVDDVWFSPGIAPASQILDIHENGLP